MNQQDKMNALDDALRLNDRAIELLERMMRAYAKEVSTWRGEADRLYNKCKKLEKKKSRCAFYSAKNPHRDE